MLTPEQLEEIRRRWADATPGPWRLRHRSASDADENSDEVYGLGWDFDPQYKGNPPRPMLRGVFARAADAHFVEYAHVDVKRLLDYIEELEAQVQDLNEALEDI